LESDHREPLATARHVHAAVESAAEQSAAIESASE
jgi:hypothetical protein